MANDLFLTAGDFVKFGFPMAASATQLGWGAVTWRAGYESAGELQNMVDSLQWATDYFVKAHTSVDPPEFVGQVMEVLYSSYYDEKWNQPSVFSDRQRRP